VLLSENQALRQVGLLEAQGENPFLCLNQLLEAACPALACGPLFQSLKPALAVKSFSHCVTLISSL